MGKAQGKLFNLKPFWMLFVHDPQFWYYFIKFTEL